MSVVLYLLNTGGAATVLAAAGWLAARGPLRHRPALRVEVCLTTCAALLLCPFLGALPALAPIPVDLGGSVPPHSGGGPSTGAASLALSPLVVLVALWLMGIGVGACRLAAGWLQVRRLRCRLTPWTPPVEIERAVRRTLGRALPPVFVSERVATPVAVGVFRPIVIVPAALVGAPDVALRQVILHECAHIAFGHLPGGVLERAIRLIFWPHPLVALLCRELARAREEVCDSVASQVDGAACYARTLLGIAQGALAAPGIPSTLALLGPETSLEDRIAGLLDPRRNPMIRLPHGARASVVGATLLLLGATAAVRVTAAVPPPTAEPAPKPAPVAKPAPKPAFSHIRYRVQLDKPAGPAKVWLYRAVPDKAPAGRWRSVSSAHEKLDIVLDKQPRQGAQEVYLKLDR